MKSYSFLKILICNVFTLFLCANENTFAQVVNPPTACSPSPADITAGVLGEPETIVLPADKAGVYPNGKPVPTLKEMLGVNVLVGDNNNFAAMNNLTDIFSSARHFFHMNKDYYNDNLGLPSPLNPNYRIFKPYADRGRLNLIVDSSGKPVNRSGFQTGDKLINFDAGTNQLASTTISSFYDPYQNYMNINYLNLLPIYQKFNSKIQATLTVVPDNFPSGIQGDYSFPATWWTEADWGTTPANIRVAARAYAMMFARTYAPKAADCTGCSIIVGHLEIGNESWNYTAATYQAIVDGFIVGIDDYYASDPANKIKLIPAAFQSNHIENSTFPANSGIASTWKDYIGTRISPSHKCYLDGANYHTYSNDLSDISGAVNNGGCYGERLIAFPEKVVSGVAKSKFLYMKNAWKWVQQNMTLSTNTALKQNIFVSEFGFDSYNLQSGCAKPWWCTDPATVNNATGVGEDAQGNYLVRSILMLARFGAYRVHLYEAIDGFVPTCDYAYHSSGVWRRSGATVVEKSTKKTLHKFIHLAGSHKFNYKISEVSGGLYAYTLEDASGVPKYLVSWKAVDVKDQSWATIKSNITTNTAINLSINGTPYQVNTSASWYLLDDQITTDVNNAVTNTFAIAQSDVYDAATTTFKIRPVPFLIPIIPTSCSNITNAGAIGASQNICAPYDPTLITSTTLPTGGTGTIEYLWQSSNTSASATDFTTIAAATSSTFDPTTINFSTWYKRGARRTGCSAYLFTTALAKTSTNVTNAGVVAANQAVCGTNNITNDPAAFTSTSSATGGAGITYKWQKATAAATGPFTDIAPAVTTTTYNPSAITQNTWYRRVAKNNACTTTTYVPSNTIAVSYSAACSTTDISVSFLEKCTLTNGNVRMKVKVDNLGTTTVSNVIVTFTGLCSGYNPSGTNVPPGSSYDAGFCPSYPQKWTITSAAPSSSYTLTIEYYLGAAVTITAAHSTAGDSNSGNNSAQFTNTALPSCAGNAIDFAVAFTSKCTMSNGNVKMGLTASNLGTTTLTNSIVTFTGLCNGYNPSGTNAPSGTTYDQGFCPSFPQKWTINNLAAGASTTLVIEYYLNTGVTISATNTTAGDAVTGNNIASFDNTGLTSCVNGTGVPGKPQQKIINETDLMTYPNPFNTILNFDVLSQEEVMADVILTSITGQVVITKREKILRGINKMRLDTDKLSSGIYLLSVDLGNNAKMVKRVIKVE